MLRENLQDSAEILTNILSEPLQIAGAETPVSLFGAAMSYDPQAGANSDLSKLLRTMFAYPESTRMLIQELNLIVKDLTQT